jgi:hypothetical protein
VTIVEQYALHQMLKMFYLTEVRERKRERGRERKRERGCRR